MHEYAVTENIIEIVEAEAGAAGGGRVARITVVIGELTSFSGESIEFYFAEMARGTRAEDACFHFLTQKASAECRSCRELFRPQHFLSVCPGCGSASYDVLAGKELYIDSIEMSDEVSRDHDAAADSPSRQEATHED